MKVRAIKTIRKCILCGGTLHIVIMGDEVWLKCPQCKVNMDIEWIWQKDEKEKN
jgi:phage FluMu protein Com